MQGNSSKPLRVFWSYSHKDQALREKLAVHFAVMRREGLIIDWHDRKIDAGTLWEEEIDRHLLEADIVLLLVSAAFFDSNYCWGNEMKKALALHRENKARVVPVILHPCQWKRTPLTVLQAVPMDGKPISEWVSEHAACDDVASQIARVAEELRRAEEEKQLKAQQKRQRAQAEARRRAEEHEDKRRAEEQAQDTIDEVPARHKESESVQMEDLTVGEERKSAAKVARPSNSAKASALARGQQPERSDANCISSATKCARCGGMGVIGGMTRQGIGGWQL